MDEWLIADDGSRAVFAGYDDVRVGAVDPLVDAPVAVSVVEALSHRFDDVESADIELHQSMARRIASISDAVEMARSDPSGYVPAAFCGQADAAEFSVRAALLELAMRLHASEGTIRTQAYEAETLRSRLPLLWREFCIGFAPYANARAAVQHLGGLTSDQAAVDQYDRELADAATRLTPSKFSRLARSTRERLHRESAAERQAQATTERRVIFDPADDGMMWMSALLPASDAVRIRARLSATAKGMSVAERAGRTRAQIRADLAAAWLAGEGTATAAKVRPILQIPALGLLGASAQRAVLEGYGPIDMMTAARLLDEAGAFRRELTHPVTGVTLDLDRRARVATKAQRLWLRLTYRTCAVNGCSRPAVECDIDHNREWGCEGGPTDIDNLTPLCSSHHREAQHADDLPAQRRRNDHRHQPDRLLSGHRHRHQPSSRSAARSRPVVSAASSAAIPAVDAAEASDTARRSALLSAPDLRCRARYRCRAGCRCRAGSCASKSRRAENAPVLREWVT